MGYFLFFAAFGWLIVTTLVLLEGRLRQPRDGKPMHTYRLGGLHVVMTPTAANILLGTIFVAGMLALVVVTASQVANTGYLYRTYEFLTSRRFAQAMVGMIFGALLASWMIRIYRNRRANELSLPQKIEGLALLFLFIVGGTTISIDEILRSVGYDKDGLSIRLAAGTDPALDAPQNQTPSVLAARQDGQPARDPIHESFGMQMLMNLPKFMERDSDLIAIDVRGKWDPDAAKAAVDIKTAARNYQDRYAATAKCLADITAGTGDSVFLNTLLSETKRALRELFLLALSQRKHGQEYYTAQTAGAAGDFDFAFDALKLDLAAHAANIVPGIRAIDAARGTSDRLDIEKCTTLRADIPAKNALIATPGYQDRPYLALVYAAMLQLENQELAAIGVLDDWLAVYRANHKKTARELEDDILFRWYRIRILHAQNWLFETLYKRDPAQQIDVLERWLAGSSALAKAYLDTDLVARNYQLVFSRPKPMLAAIGRIQYPRPEQGCPVDRNAVLLSFSLMSARLGHAERSIEHPEFFQRYRFDANEALEDILQAEMSCVAEYLGERDASLFKAEALLAHAQMLTREARERQPISENSRSRNREALNKALDSLLRARALIVEFTRPGADDGEAELPPLRETTREQILLRRLDAMIRSNQQLIDRSEGL